MSYCLFQAFGDLWYTTSELEVLFLAVIDISRTISYEFL